MQQAARSTGTEDMPMTADNIAREMTRSLIFGMNSSDPAQTLRNFSAFSVLRLNDRRISMSGFWIIFSGEGSAANVTVGNYLASSRTFKINISGAVKNIYVDPGNTSSDTFPLQGDFYNASVGIDSEEFYLRMQNNKISLFSSLSLEREGNLIKKEFIA
jgi:hypothetical protein